MLPVWGINADATCACGHPHDGSPAYPGADKVLDAKSIGKHPVEPDWPTNATTDIAVVEKYWNLDKCTFNVGIHPGPGGWIVVDIDGPEGEEELRRLEAEHGALPVVMVVATGRGRHIYLRAPDRCHADDRQGSRRRTSTSDGSTAR